MKIFLDTANIEDIKEINSLGVIHGVTTNPSLIAKEKRDLKEIASIRNPIHVIEAAKLGANIGTLPPSVIRALINHPLTDSGIEKFKEDWEKANL